MNIHWQLMILLFASLSWGYENRCHTRSNSPVRSLCPTRSYLNNNIRNFHSSTHRIECTGNSDNYLRVPQVFDFRKWADLRAEGKEDEAFQLRQSLPDIKWTGQVPFQTYEMWTWEDCVLGTNAFECGTHEECDRVTEQECSTDSKGNRSCRNVTRKVCHDVPNTCFYDENRSESVFCTNEEMTYKSGFERPGRDWTPQGHPYAPFIPNKYDLLPGELENIQTYNNTSSSTSVTPEVIIGDAWNKYHYEISPASFVCRPNGRYDINVNIVTLERDTTKTSPNAFRLPVDLDGNAIEPLRWLETQQKGKAMKTYPIAVKLQDQSAAVINSIAAHSRKNAKREKLKSELKLPGSQKAESGFFKNTIVKVQLVKKNRWWWDNKLNHIYSEDMIAVEPDVNNLSDDYAIMQSEDWLVDLKNSNNLYGDHSPLRPDRVYGLDVSMYQKGVPFYLQSCDDDPKVGVKWWCKMWRRDGKVFSKPLEIEFETNSNYDARDEYNFIDRWTSKISEAVDNRSLFEWIFHKRTTGANK